MKINLAHGNGAEETSYLIDNIFMKYFSNQWNKDMTDSVILDIPHFYGKGLTFTTDSFVVKPLFFPGGDIGKLAVCGTVNDLLTAGGTPLFLSASFIIEEGMEFEELDRIVKSMEEAAREANVHIVTGDTKVIEGTGGIYINTSGIGVAEDGGISLKSATAGDGIIVTGNLGDHHACILSRRMDIKNNIKSDAAPLTGIVEALRREKIPIHGMRDITRGGLATVLNEISRSLRLGAQINEADIPVADGVKGLCGILGLDPLYMGNEGKMLILIPGDMSKKAIEIIRRQKYGENAMQIGCITAKTEVTLKTKIGGLRIIPPLSGEGLPRIC